MLRALSIVGLKNVGKTTCMVEVAKILHERGLKVLGVKFSHTGFDRENSDTAQLNHYCESVIGITESESFISWNKKLFLADLVKLTVADILLVEGGKNLSWLPKIAVIKELSDWENLKHPLIVGTWRNKINNQAYFENAEQIADYVIENGFSLPGLDCGSCEPKSCLSLGMKIIEKEASLKDCVALNTKMTISANEQEIALNPFVENIIGNGIRGMLSQLKGINPGTEINIKLK